jgi:superfamily I DNA and/or RNA helicase
MLDVQYRMHPAISRFPAQEFYDSTLIDGTIDLLGNISPGLNPPDSKHLINNSVTGRPSLVFIDHTGNESMKGRSIVNVMEGHIVASVVEDLLLNNEVGYFLIRFLEDSKYINI